MVFDRCFASVVLAFPSTHASRLLSLHMLSSSAVPVSVCLLSLMYPPIFVYSICFLMECMRFEQSESGRRSDVGIAPDHERPCHVYGTGNTLRKKMLLL